jgi:hypothetical protein
MNFAMDETVIFFLCISMSPLNELIRSWMNVDDSNR